MDGLKKHMMVAKFAMGAFLGATLLTTSLVYAENRSACTMAQCTEYSISSASTAGICSTAAQYQVSESGTGAWYPCFAGKNGCEPTSSATATCKGTGCTTSACSTFTTEQACKTAATMASAGATSGTFCQWTSGACQTNTAGKTVLCASYSQTPAE